MMNGDGRIRGGSTTTSADRPVDRCRLRARRFHSRGARNSGQGGFAPRASAPEQTTFSSRIDAVRVDVLVTENGGR